MALSPAIAKIGNRKAPVFQHWGFLSCYMEALTSFLPIGIIAYAIHDCNIHSKRFFDIPISETMRMSVSIIKNILDCCLNFIGATSFCQGCFAPLKRLCP